MVTAAYSERERGHTGNYFNYALGVAGRRARAVHWRSVRVSQREQSWYYDLARRLGHEFCLSSTRPFGAEEHRQVHRMGLLAAVTCLTYALPLKRLRLTGRKPFTVPALDMPRKSPTSSPPDATSPSRKTRTAMKNAQPSNCSRAFRVGRPSFACARAAAIGKRDGRPPVPRCCGNCWLATNREARYGAVRGSSRQLGSRADVAAPQLRAALRE